jgi:N-acetylglucosamine malate deacetylase 1
MVEKHHTQAIIRWLLALAVILSIAGVGIYLSEMPTVTPQRLIESFPDAKVPASAQKVLIFSPHPDDETIALGGYIAFSHVQGAQVRVVLVTDGNKHRKAAIRYTEFKEATSILGLPESDLVFLDFPDGTLSRLDASLIAGALKKQIDLYQPDFIIYPHVRDSHPDHYTLGRIIRGILDTGSAEKPISYEYLVHFEFFYPQPYKYAPNLNLTPPRSLVASNVEWLRFVLPSSLENLKLRAVNSYQSQLRDPVLRELILSSIRKNELLAVISP